MSASNGVVVLRARSPRKLDDPVRRTSLIEALAIGTPRVHACAAVRISEDTLARALKDDAEFAESVKAAEAQAVGEALMHIRNAAQEGNWTAAAWFLERRYPQEFGRRTILAGDKEQTGMTFTLNIGEAAAD